MAVRRVFGGGSDGKIPLGMSGSRAGGGVVGCGQGFAVNCIGLNWFQLNIHWLYCVPGNILLALIVKLLIFSNLYLLKKK